MVPERHNTVKVLLFLDVGGSMDDHIRLTEELFSAARTAFKHLEYYYFHHFPYEKVWKNNRRLRRALQRGTRYLLARPPRLPLPPIGVAEPDPETKLGPCALDHDGQRPDAAPHVSADGQRHRRDDTRVESVEMGYGCNDRGRL